MDRIIESKGGNDYDRRASSHDQRAREPKAGPRAVGIAGVGGIVLVVTQKNIFVTTVASMGIAYTWKIQLTNLSNILNDPLHTIIVARR